MGTVTSNQQLNTFTIVRDILNGNSTLNAKITLSDYYDFQPNPKSTGFKGFPYILINVPEAEPIDEYLGDIVENKEFSIEIVLRVDYIARDKFTSFSSNILSQLRGSNSSFQASGYELMNITFDGSNVVYVNQKQVVEGTFTLTLQGEVNV